MFESIHDLISNTIGEEEASTVTTSTTTTVQGYKNANGEVFDSIHDLIGSASSKEKTSTMATLTTEAESGHMNANGEVFESIHDLINDIFDDNEESSLATFRNPNEDGRPLTSALKSTSPSESPNATPITPEGSHEPTIITSSAPTVLQFADNAGPEYMSKDGQMFDSIHDLIDSVSSSSTETKVEGYVNKDGEVFESIHDLIDNAASGGGGDDEGESRVFAASSLRGGEVSPSQNDSGCSANRSSMFFVVIGALFVWLVAS